MDQTSARLCKICNQQSLEVEQATVRSNVRKFAHEEFVIWRCPHCRSIHSRDEVDLDHYYADYPFHDYQQASPWLTRAIYSNFLSRLRRVGIRKDDSLLDYGCGAGEMLEFLRSQGFRNVEGYDEYSESFADTAPLNKQYDLVTSQDVLEHVADPTELARTLHDLTRPGGLIMIGTPNADAIDISRPERRVHHLHQPYHRHLLSRNALEKLGTDMGWQLVHYYPSIYANTRVPFINASFIMYYLRCFDDCIDTALEPPKGSWKLLNPMTLVYGLFGSFLAPPLDSTAFFRRPA